MPPDLVAAIARQTAGMLAATVAPDGLAWSGPSAGMIIQALRGNGADVVYLDVAVSSS